MEENMITLFIVLMLCKASAIADDELGLREER